MSMDLTNEKILTYKTGVPPLTRREIMELSREVPNWSISDGHIIRRFTFNNSSESLAFINDIIGFSQAEGHVPDVALKDARNVEISFYTYPAGGLTWNDFIMAAKLNAKFKAEGLG
jgi:4a-hydroxytetrahydrobiopterin dehydratase